MKISIVIPVYNEGKELTKLLNFLASHPDKEQYEVILVDGGSEDNTLDLIADFSFSVYSSRKGRGNQLHFGARQARYSVLYFLHADTLPPTSFVQDIQQAFASNKIVGCFRLQFQPKHWLLSFYSFFVKFPFLVCRGGDQSLFIQKRLYFELGGFDTQLAVMEDIDFIARVNSRSKFSILSKRVTTSSRKYERNGMIRLQIIYACMHFMRFAGIHPERIFKFYRQWVK